MQRQINLFANFKSLILYQEKIRNCMNLKTALINTTNSESNHNELFNKKIWHLDDVIEFTKYKKRTIYNLVCRDEIPHIKQRKRLIFIPQEILNWMMKG